jgi:PAS domain S-box-containing protein
MSEDDLIYDQGTRECKSVEKTAIEQAKAQAVPVPSANVVSHFHALVLTDDQGRILRWSNAAETLFGFRREEIMGRHLSTLLEQKENGNLGHFNYFFLNEAHQGKISNTVAFRKNATVFPVEISCTKIQLEGRGAWIAVFRDITEKVQVYDERQELQAQLFQAQKMEAIGQLAGGVAHDFNNILTAILMQLSLLRSDYQISKEMQSELEDIESQAMRASALTRQLLLFSRRNSMNVQVLNIGALLENQIKMLNRIIGENIHVKEVIEDYSLLWVKADSGRVEQVIMNLAVNARDAMPNGGEMKLKASRVTLSKAECDSNPLARPGEFVCVSVSDTGCGMSEEIKKQIFEPFFTTKGPGHGTGLGLATVQNIAKQHQGWIDVLSTPGKGSTFSIFFPAELIGGKE